MLRWLPTAAPKTKTQAKEMPHVFKTETVRVQKGRPLTPSKSCFHKSRCLNQTAPTCKNSSNSVRDRVPWTTKKCWLAGIKVSKSLTLHIWLDRAQSAQTTSWSRYARTARLWNSPKSTQRYSASKFHQVVIVVHKLSRKKICRASPVSSNLVRKATGYSKKPWRGNRLLRLIKRSFQRSDFQKLPECDTEPTVINKNGLRGIKAHNS